MFINVHILEDTWLRLLVAEVRRGRCGRVIGTARLEARGRKDKESKGATKPKLYVYCSS